MFSFRGPVRSIEAGPVSAAAAAGKLRLVDAGLAYDADAFWFDLKPGAGAAARPWLQRVELVAYPPNHPRTGR